MPNELLLAKEKEMYELNKELEKKTRSIMEEVDSFLKTRVDVSKILNNVSCRSYPEDKIERFFEPNGANDDELEVMQDNCLPRIPEENERVPVKKRESELTTVSIEKDVSHKKISSGNKAIIDFLKTKVIMLHNELNSMQLEYKKKLDYCEELEVENKKLDTGKVKLIDQITTLKETIGKLENSNTELRSQNQASNTEKSNLKKDIDGLKKEAKTLNQQSNNCDLRLNRVLEENEKLRNAIKLNRTEEKELRDQIRRLQEDTKLTIKNLEKQRSELLQAFKKQMLLIDNLKKQNAFLIASKQIEFAEEEFSKLLEWKPRTLYI